jgi:signal transduction histidine kinase
VRTGLIRAFDGIAPTIGTKLNLILMLTSASAVVFACTLFTLISALVQRTEYVRDLTSLALVIGRCSSKPVASGTVREAASALAALAAKPSVEAAWIYDSSGTVLVSYCSPHLAEPPNPPDPTEDGADFAGGKLLVFSRLDLDGASPGTIGILQNMAPARRALWRSLAILLAVTAASLMLAYALASRLKSLVANPILSLAATARAVAEDGDYSTRASEDRPDELGTLTRAMNRMLGTIEHSHAELQSEVRERQQAVIALRESQDQLETKVRERTDQLEQTNRRLREEVRGHRESEQRLRSALEGIRRYNAELRQFAYVASHDLQEPLRKISAFGDRLGSLCGGQLGTTGQDYLRRMLDASSRLQALISDLLTYSRIATKPREIADVQMTGVTDEVLEGFAETCKECGAQIEVESMPAIEGERQYLALLMRSLIDNALKFRDGERPPRIRIAAAWPLPDGQGRTGRLFCRITVADNGIGFDEKYLDRVFQIFQRLHARDEYSGTGMGLAVAERIAKRHGGRLEAASRPGEGTVFTIWLPLHQDRESGAAPTETS